MKPATVLLTLSLAANVALGIALLSRGHDDRSCVSRINSAGAGTGSTTDTVMAADDRDSGSLTPVALRAQLRALGLSEDEVESGVRAGIESRRYSRQRELAREAATGPWWRAVSLHPDPTRTLSLELRELRKAEQVALASTLGAAGVATRAERERYAFLPEDKAARLAALERDYQEMNREVTAPSAGPQSRAEAEARLKLIKEEHERDRKALLSSEELADVDRRTSIAAWSVSLNAKYFDATEAEFRKILEITRDHRAEARMDEPMAPGRSGGIEPLKKYTERLITLLGQERYAEWNAAQFEPVRALRNLQQRFDVPPETVALLKELPKTVGDEGLTLVKTDRREAEKQIIELRALAERTRDKVRTLLGSDLGDAYNDAAAKGWLDHLENGSVPFIQPNGQRAIHGSAASRGNLPQRPAAKR